MEQEVRPWMFAPTALAASLLWQRSGWQADWAEIVLWAEAAQAPELDLVLAAEARLATLPATESAAAVEACQRDLNQAYHKLNQAFDGSRKPRP